MNKIYIENYSKKKLALNYVNENSDTLVILAHGFTNDKSSNGRFDRLVTFLKKQSIDSIAFDFSGSGESDNAPLTLEIQTKDLSSIIQFAQSKQYRKIILFGNSFGTLACMRNAESSISSMILLGAVTDSMNYNWNEIYTSDELDSLNEKGCFFMNDERKHQITKQTLKDFENINQEEMISRIKCPVLIIHGDSKDDLEELELLENSKRAIKLLNDDSRLEVIKDGKHGFHEKWDDVINLTWEWLQESVIKYTIRRDNI